MSLSASNCTSGNSPYAALSTETGIHEWEFDVASGFKPSITCLAKSASEARDEHSKILTVERSNAVLAAWNKLALIETKSATTWTEILAAYYQSSRHSESRFLACDKWNSYFLMFVRDAKDPHAAKWAYDNAHSGTEAKARARLKWDELSMSLAENAKTCTVMATIHQQAPEGSLSQLYALKKWKLLSLTAIASSNTTEDASEALRTTPSEYDLDCYKLAFTKLNQVASSEIDSATTIAELTHVLQFLPRVNDTRDKGIAKILALYKEKIDSCPKIS